MSGNTLLSFCCVSYNHEQFIEDCIKSIWNNDYKNIEIFVLDDGSKDKSVEILNKLKKISPCPMTIISQSNSGQIGANFNKLINMSNGDYISIISCDDMLVENSLNSKMQDMIANDKLAYICHSKVIGIDENNNKNTFVPLNDLDKIENPTANDVLELDFNKIHSYYTQGSIYRKDILKAVDLFDDDMICDDIILRTKLSRFLINNPEWNFKVLHLAGVYYRKHSTNVSQNSIRQVVGVIEYLNKYWTDREPPKAIFDWIEHAISQSNEKSEILNIFLKNDYIYKILSIKNYLDMFFNNGILYKKIGIPFVFEIKKYKKWEEKLIIIKLLNIPIFKYRKKIKNK